MSLSSQNESTEPTCPRCSVALQPEASSSGVTWTCPQCHGRAVGLAVLRGLFTAESVNSLWLHTIDGNGRPGAACPSCRNPMMEVALSDASRIGVDVCRLCQFVWFDPGEMEGLKPQPAEERARSLLEQELKMNLAMKNLNQMSAKMDESAAADFWRSLASFWFYP